MQLAKDEAAVRRCAECMSAMQRGAERMGMAASQLPDSFLIYRHSWVHLLWNLSTAFGLPEATVHHALALLDVAMASGLSCGGEPMMRLVASCCLLLAATALNQAPYANGALIGGSQDVVNVTLNVVNVTLNVYLCALNNNANEDLHAAACDYFQCCFCVLAVIGIVAMCTVVIGMHH